MSIRPAPSSRPGRRGFTLIELLVVISIVSVMVALLLPALGRARDAAQLVKCLSNERQQAVAYLAYATDFDTYGPPQNVWRTPPNNHLNGPDYGRSHWMISLAPYMNVPPGATTTSAASYPHSADARMPVFQCPTTWSLGAFSDTGHSYGINSYLISPHTWSWSSTYGYDYAWGPMPLSVLDRRGNADRLVLTGDCYVYTPKSNFNSWQTSITHALPTVGGKNHDGGLNWAFADGHAAYYQVNVATYNDEDTSGNRIVDLAVGKTDGPWDFVGISW